MNEDYYENEIRKNMNQIDTLNSKAEISDDKELHTIVDQMGQIISNTEKTVKNYNIYNVMNNNDQTKTNTIQRKEQIVKKMEEIKRKIEIYEKKIII